MQTLLENLNAVPGVVGSMICDVEGRVVGHAFPAEFDDAVLAGAAAVLADGSVGLQTVTGPIGLVDLRYGAARVVAKPLSHGLVLLLCEKSVNLQRLLIEVAVAGKRLERIATAVEVAAPAEPDAAAPAEPDAAAGDAAGAAPESPSGSGKPKKKKSWWPSV